MKIPNEMNRLKILALAERIATDAHAGQFRRGGIVPYIEHPRAVADRVAPDLDAQIVAWLHDVLEDCDVTAEQLLELGIPAMHVNAIQLLTKVKGLSYCDYIERITTSKLATIVKIGDMQSNLEDNPSDHQIKKYSPALATLKKAL